MGGETTLLLQMNGSLRGLKPGHFWLCVCVDRSDPPPITWLVYVENGPHPLSWGVMVELLALSSEQEFFSMFSESLSHGPVTSLIGSHSSPSSATTPFFILPWERVNWFYFRLSPCLCSFKSSGCLELFSNSHLSVLWPSGNRSSLPPDNHENHLIWVHSCLVVPLGCSLSKCSLEFCLRSCRPASRWPSEEPFNPSGLEPDSALS